MSKIEVNTVDVQCGSTLTLGSCGKTVALASGASQSGFGRTGTVDWVTDSIKTATFTAETGKGYFCNTTGGTFTVNLPAGAAGSIVSIQDYNNTFDSNALTVDPNGSEKINGGEAGGEVSLSAQGQGLTLVYIDSTVGWRSIQENEYDTTGVTPAFVTASGGTVTTVCTNYKVHTFTGPGTFTVSCAGNSSGSNTVSYMVIAGGGSGGHGCSGGGGGGAGGYREGLGLNDSYTGSPLRSPTGIPVTATGYPITVGAGAAAVSNPAVGNDGSTSTFSTISSAGGGGGGRWNVNGAKNGGSGGGSAGPPSGPGGSNGGSGNTPPVSPPQGNAGGNLGYWQMAGGGGAGAVGTAGHAPCGSCGGSASNRNSKGDGGAGVTSSINGTPTARAGGGGGGHSSGPSLSPGTDFAPGGTGGGAKGDGSDGTANTGGGGSGSPQPNPGASGAGGSGIVIIRYKFQ